MAEKKYALKIGDVLTRLSKKQTEFTEEEQKAMAPVVLMRWLSGTRSARQVFFINEIINPYVFSLYGHKQLLINLMTMCTDGKYQRYNWVPRKAKDKKIKHVLAVICEYHSYTERQAEDVVGILDHDTILQYAEELGYQKEQMRDLKKELKTL